MLSRRRFLTLTAGYVTASALVSACVAPVASPGASSGAEAAPGTEETVLTYWALPEENDNDNLTRGLVDPFEEANPTIKVNMELVPWEGYYEKYQTLTAAGQAPDLAFVSAAWIQDFAHLGVALNLDPFVEKTGVFGPDDEDKYFLKVLDGLRYPGTQAHSMRFPMSG
jgi:ABC-type glycerol-3-phosphate transport system substrate-binding protein